MAPSKKDSDSAAGEAVRGLCILMQSAPDFNPDYNVVAQALGIAQAKNVPRKIDTFIRPYGYMIKNKKIVRVDGDREILTTQATPRAKAKATVGPSDVGGGKENISTKKSLKMLKIPKSTASAKKDKTPAKKVTATPKMKKRKMEEAEADSEDEAIKMIKETMGDGTDEELGKGAEDQDQDEGEGED